MARLKYFASVTQKISEKNYDISYIYKIFLNKLWTVLEWSRVKGLNNSKSSYFINTIMAEFRCSHNSSYLGLVYTWNFKRAIDLLFFSQRLQQSYAAVLQGLHSKLSKVSQTFHSHVESFEQSQGDLTADKENTFISFK